MHRRRQKPAEQETVLRWLKKHDEFRVQGAHAREVQADTIVDQILDIAANGRNDRTEDRNADSEALAGRRNGDKLDVNVTSQVVVMPSTRRTCEACSIGGC